MKQVELKIKGMHCKSCSIIVQEAVADVKGVKTVAVDLEKAKAKISYDETIVKEKQLVDAIEKEGYKVTK